MTQVSVVYHSQSGYTKLMAEGVREGVASVAGAEVRLLRIEGGDFEADRWSNDEILTALDDSDAIIFGCPTHMGDVSSTFKAFLDATLHRWYARAWSGKVAAGFTVSSTPSGDKLQALSSLLMCAMQHGMLWVGLDQSPINPDALNRLSFYLGAAGQPDYGAEQPTLMAGDRETGVIHGARVARIASDLLTARATL